MGSDGIWVDDGIWMDGKEGKGPGGRKTALLFGGTTEGRLLAGFLVSLGCPTVVCVATEYGRDMLGEMAGGRAGTADCLEPAKPALQDRPAFQDRPAGREGMPGLLDIRQGRLTQAGMEELIREVDPGIVIDATHPYAAEASAHIKGACGTFRHIRSIRCAREPGLLSGPGVIRVPDVEAAVSWLSGRQGNILAAMGIKELPAFCGLPDYRQRVYARVLPSVESVKACRELGFDGRHVIAIQGPFSVEMNLALFKEYGCRYLVTKDGGRAGGMKEKLEAARTADVRAIVIDRPDGGAGPGLEEVKRQIKEWMDHEG